MGNGFGAKAGQPQRQNRGQQQGDRQRGQGQAIAPLSLHQVTHPERRKEAADAVTARKDDAPAADHAAITNVVGLVLFSGAGGLIQTTSG